MNKTSKIKEEEWKRKELQINNLRAMQYVYNMFTIQWKQVIKRHTKTKTIDRCSRHLDYCLSDSVTTLPTSTIRPHTTSYVDPCSTYETLPNYESRFIQNVVNETSFFIDDKNLPEHWYRAGNWDIPRNVPNLFHCGTLYPGYLTGSVFISEINDIASI